MISALPTNWLQRIHHFVKLQPLNTYTELMQSQESVDHILTNLSSPADTKSFPLAPYRTALIESEWKGFAESSTKETGQSPLSDNHGKRSTIQLIWTKLKSSEVNSRILSIAHVAGRAQQEQLILPPTTKSGKTETLWSLEPQKTRTSSDDNITEAKIFRPICPKKLEIFPTNRKIQPKIFTGGQNFHHLHGFTRGTRGARGTAHNPIADGNEWIELGRVQRRGDPLTRDRRRGGPIRQRRRPISGQGARLSRREPLRCLGCCCLLPPFERPPSLFFPAARLRWQRTEPV